MPEASKGERIFRGIPVSTGVCRGKILVVDRTRPAISGRKVTESEISEEINRLEKALVQTRQQILEVQRKVSEGMGAQEGSIFDAHLLVLEDRTLLDEVVRIIKEERVNAEYAFHSVAERYATTLAAIEDDYLRERATDMRDVTSRVLNTLLGREDDLDLRHLKEPCIIIAHDLTPSNTAQLDKRNVLGFGTDVGSKTSHTAIMARHLRIPAVVGLKHASSELANGQYALLDGFYRPLVELRNRGRGYAVSLVKATRRARVVAGEAEDGKAVIVSVDRAEAPHFLAVSTRATGTGEVALPEAARKALGVGPGDEVGFVYLER